MKGDSSGSSGPSAFDLIEEALLLLKRIGLGAFGIYGAGTLAFLWALLYFFAHMSRNALAPARLTEYSFLLALAFVGMKITHALFFTRLIETLEGEGPAPASWRKLARVACTQALVQPLGLFLLPIALILTVPLPWVVAFFQNAQWVADRDSSREWLSRSFRMALLWPKQNLYIHFFLLAAIFCIFLNIAVALFAVPHFLASFFGIDTVFTRSHHVYLNTTFFMVVLTLSWAALDPLVKAIFALRCFRGMSINTGRDLRLALGRFKVSPAPASGPGTKAKVLVLACLFLLPFSAFASGSSAGPIPVPAQAAPAAALSPSRLDTLLNEEIAASRYGWRMPQREGDGAGEGNFLTRWVGKIRKQVDKALTYIVDKVRRFSRWIDSLIGRKGGSDKEAAPASKSTLPIRILLVAMLGGLAVVVSIFFIKRISKGRPLDAPVVVPEPKAPDLASEETRAEDLPEEEWLRLMEQLRLKGEHRLAMRALFLAMLSVSARRGWLIFARHKSNRDYQREVHFKSKRKPPVALSFRENCLRFDRVWYGAHPVSEEDWAICRANYAVVGGDEA